MEQHALYIQGHRNAPAVEMGYVNLIGVKINTHVPRIVKGLIIHLYHGHLDGMAFLPSNKDMDTMLIGQMFTINLIIV